MGLDMYLYGEKFFWKDYENPDNDRKEEGLRIASLRVDLGYWRKHPDLHGFIVQAFAEGKDDCQEIELNAQSIRNIISAVTYRKLPHTEGFFFGQSDPSSRKNDIKTFERALDWLEIDEAETPKAAPKLGVEKAILGPGEGELMSIAVVKFPEVMPRVTRSVIYRASW